HEHEHRTVLLLPLGGDGAGHVVVARIALVTWVEIARRITARPENALPSMGNVAHLYLEGRCPREFVVLEHKGVAGQQAGGKSAMRCLVRGGEAADEPGPGRIVKEEPGAPSGMEGIELNAHHGCA